LEINQLLNHVAQALYDKKGFNIIALDVRGLTNLADFFLIAEGNVPKHVQALSKEIYNELASKGEKPFHMEGGALGEWVVMDYSNVMIHLFSPGLRETYDLEGLWRKGKIVSLDIQVAS
jgi:ribosome-associated protein